MLLRFLKDIINFLFKGRVLVSYFKYYRPWKKIVNSERNSLLKKGFQIDKLNRVGKIIEVPSEYLQSLQFVNEDKHEALVERMRIETISAFLNSQNDYFLEIGLRELLNRDYLVEKSSIKDFSYYLIFYPRVVKATNVEVFLKIIFLILLAQFLFFGNILISVITSIFGF